MLTRDKNGKRKTNAHCTVFRFTMWDLYLAIVVLHVYSLQIVYGLGMGVSVNLLTG